jgi:hypothetical protein
MSKAKEYHRLQQLDSDIDAKTVRLAIVEASLGQRDAVDAVKVAFEEAQTALDEARAQQRDLEWELENTKQKLARLEKTMYSGSVKNPKELDDMRQESEHLQRRRGELQDRILDAMMTVEELEERAGTQREVWEGAEQAWADEQEALRMERETLQEELATLRDEREVQAGRLAAAGLTKYERLRVKKGGQAVVLMQGAVCTGCRLSLPAVDVQKVRADAAVNFCPHCGRILVYGGPA